MTNQLSDALLNECPEIAFGGLFLYGVVTGDITKNHGWGENYEFKSKPNLAKGILCTALWRGYVSYYKLLDDGTLMLEYFGYPLSENQEPDIANEQLEGDFWLVMKERFRGERTYVPFRSGRIVSDKNEWIDEKSLKNIAIKSAPLGRWVLQAIGRFWRALGTK